MAASTSCANVNSPDPVVFTVIPTVIPSAILCCGTPTTLNGGCDIHVEGHR